MCAYMRVQAGSRWGWVELLDDGKLKSSGQRLLVTQMLCQQAMHVHHMRTNDDAFTFGS